MRCTAGRFLLFPFVFSTLLLAQTPPTSDPQALTFAAQSVAAMSGTNTITDVTMTGTATWMAGSNNGTGTATAYAKGTTESRVDLVLNSGNRSDILNSSSGTPAGDWIDSTGTTTAYAYQNCWTDASWFFPALGSLSAAATNPNVVLTYVGLEQRNGASVQHIQGYLYVASNSSSVTTFAQQMSTTDYYLDATTLLPTAMIFNVHPDDTSTTSLTTEVDFSNYQNVNGSQVAFHIQRTVQGNLLLDFVVASTLFDSGLSNSLFTIQ